MHEGRLEWELEKLEAAGLSPTLRVADKAKGVVTVDMVYSPDGEPIELYAVFPDHYPYFRPEVFAPKLSLGRHQNPYGNNLCLLGRSNPDWKTTDNAADLIVTQFKEILAINDGMSEDDIKAREEPQGEPITDYLTTLKNSSISIDTSWKIPEAVAAGKLDIVAHVDLSVQDNPFVRGIVQTVYDEDGNVIETWKGKIPADHTILFKNLPWRRSTEPPAANDHQEFLGRFHAIEKEHNPTFSFRPVRVDKKFAMAICVNLIPEEIKQMEYGDGWVIASRYFKINNKGVADKPVGSSFLHVHRAGSDDLNERVPSRIAFSGKTVVVAGAGAIGAPLILDLARSGVSKIHVIEYDNVEPGNSTRWPLGAGVYGTNKADALKSFVEEHYPDTEIVPHPYKIGNFRDLKAQGGPGPDQVDLINQLVDEAHIVIDATAEVAVHRLLSDICMARAKPLICSSATPGAWGGVVVRCLPEAGQGCWYCFMKHMDDEKGAPPEDRQFPNPPSDEAGLIQPPGCADRTFIGANFDIMEIVLETLRMAAGTLGGDDGGYPNVEWDVGVVSMQNEEGRMAPNWKMARLHQHEECPICANKK